MPKRKGTTRRRAREKPLSERALTPEYLDEQLTFGSMKTRVSVALLRRYEGKAWTGPEADDVARGIMGGYLSAVGGSYESQGHRFRLGYLKRFMNFCKHLEND